MDEMLIYLWDLRTVVVFMAGACAGLVIAGLLVSARENESPEMVEGYEPPGDMIDVPGALKKWEER